MAVAQSTVAPMTGDASRRQRASAYVPIPVVAELVFPGKQLAQGQFLPHLERVVGKFAVLRLWLALRKGLRGVGNPQAAADGPGSFIHAIWRDHNYLAARVQRLDVDFAV